MTLMILLAIIISLALAILLFLQHPKFGKLPNGKRLASIKQASNYQHGAFQNISHTPDLTEGVSMFAVIKEFMFSDKSKSSPKKKIPSIKTNLLAIPKQQDVLVWFGHSSYFIQLDGKSILVDPVLSGSASPLPFGTKALDGSNIYTADDMPAIDYLFISHDHWDHLDYETILKIKPKVKQVICGLGVGQHFESWGYDTARIIEKNWNEQHDLGDGMMVYTTTARHFSGRGLKRNQSLWLSFVLQTHHKRLFLGGDSGYDKHFAEIGERFGPFDLVILENGQYDKSWKYIHLLPEEFIIAAKDLKAKRILPVHSAKFVLGNHPWNEPLELLSLHNEKELLNVITPIIGEQVNLNDSNQVFSKWWRMVD